MPSYNIRIEVSFKKATYNIKFNNAVGATITPSNFTATYGDVKEVLITANEGYKIKSIKINDENPIYPTHNIKLKLAEISSDMNIIVTTEKIPYEVKIEATEGVIIQKSFTANHGDSKNISVKTSPGYKLTSVKVNNKEMLPLTNDNILLNNISSNISINIIAEQKPYTIKINSVIGATIKSEDILAYYGDTKEISVKANSGYRLTSIKVNNVEAMPITEDKLILKNITSDMNIVITTEEIIYYFNNTTEVIDVNNDLSLKILNTNFEITEVYINNQILDPKYYELNKTTINIKSEYLYNLNDGTYNLLATTTDGGKAITNLVIQRKNMVEKVNTFFRKNNIVLFEFGYLLIIIICIIIIIKKKKKDTD